MASDYHRHDISDAEWALIEPYTIGNKGTWGENAKYTRQFINGIFGFCAQERRGGIYRLITGNGTLCTADFADGGIKESGRGVWKSVGKCLITSGQ